jgi:hypothetical protein
MRIAEPAFPVRRRDDLLRDVSTALTSPVFEAVHFKILCSLLFTQESSALANVCDYSLAVNDDASSELTSAE